jgi:hypothetical protein
MDCTAIQERLSAYFDDELAPDEQQAVASHWRDCPECAAELSSFQQLSNLAAELPLLDPPPETWARVEHELWPPAQLAREPLSQRFSRTLRGLALAVTLLLMVGATWFGYSWFTHDDHEAFTAEFGEYLEKFQRDPAEAQEFLLGMYKGDRTDPNLAIELVGYRPAVADGLPTGYSIESTYVMKMPCCTCFQCVCVRDDGTTMIVFEHNDEETEEWFGNRPETRKECAGKQCTLVQLDEGIAATWKRNGRHITVVGIWDDDELSRLVAWFDNRLSNDLQQNLQ